MKNKLLIVGMISLLGGCSTVTINTQAPVKLATAPTYQETRPFFLWGIVGEQHVDVKSICKEKSVKQMQSQQTFVNGLLGAVTLGIYAPHSVKVWCE